MKRFINIKYENKEILKTIKKSDVKKWLIQLFKELNIDNSSCSILFTGNETIQKLNNQYFNSNSPTDVISFSQIEGEKCDFIGSCFLGDIVICIPQAQKQAKQRDHSLILEVYLLLLHGLLHLLGYDHEDESNNEMNNIQKNIFYKLYREALEK